MIVMDFLKNLAATVAIAGPKKGGAGRERKNELSWIDVGLILFFLSLFLFFRLFDMWFLVFSILHPDTAPVDFRTFHRF